jgi:uncharacterized Zn-binding protein involved in type VI secretion
MKFVNKGTPTSTGGVVLEGHESVLVEGKPATSIYQVAGCNSGRPECKGVGMIVPASGMNDIYLPDGNQACVEGDKILCGCDNNYILAPDHDVNIDVYYEPSLDALTKAQIRAARKEADARVAASHHTASEPDTIQLDPNNAYWPPYNPLAQDGHQQLQVEYLTPITSIAVLSLEEAQEMYLLSGGKGSFDDIKDYSGLAKGVSQAYATAKGLGGLGVKATTRTINGQEWIIIRDFRRHQQTLMKGNKWVANNPKVVQAGIGLNDLKGATRFVKFNAGIEIAFAIGVNAADFILRDEATLAEFVGHSAGDLVKGFISLGGAALLTATAPATVSVLLTGVAFAMASFYLSQELDSLDQESGYSQQITIAVREYFQ